MQCLPVIRILLCNDLFMMGKIISRSAQANKQRLYRVEDFFYVFK